MSVAAFAAPKKQSVAITTTSASTNLGDSGSRTVIMRKGNACACGGGCPRCDSGRAIDQIERVLKDDGAPLEDSVRQFMEPRLGFDLGGVRVHTGNLASKTAQSIQARAYTVGSHVAFGEGEYAPHTSIGRELLAHELVHVAQQYGDSDNKVQRQPFGRDTGAMHRELAEEFRRRFGLPPGGIGLQSERIGPSDAEITYSREVSDVPDLHWAMVDRLRPAIASTDPATRQAALDELTAWARGQTTLGIDWRRVRSIQYDPNEAGSRTEAADPMNMRIYLGRDPFQSVSDLYATFRHELVHVVQHHAERQQVLRRGWGVQEVYAYLWEVEHAADTGHIRRENWGLDPTGQGQFTRGLARAMDGLFREMMRFAGEVHADPSRIPQAEVTEISRRIACALLSIPWEVVHAVNPNVAQADLRQACTPAASTSQPVRRSVVSGIAADSSPAESEAELLGKDVAQGGSAVGRIQHQADESVSRSLRIEGSELEVSRLQSVLQRLTGRTVSLSEGPVSLGDPITGSQSSATIRGFVERAISSTRTYRLRIGTQALPAVEGAVDIAIDPATVGEFAFTLDDQVSVRLPQAVTTGETTAAGSEPAAVAGEEAEDLRTLTETLPYGATESTSPDELMHLRTATATRVFSFLMRRYPSISRQRAIDMMGLFASATGVTLAEILRGIETNTPYRIEQRVEGGRVTAVYVDPLAGERDRTRRTVTFVPGSTGRAAGAYPLPRTGETCQADPSVMNPTFSSTLPNSCCSTEMLNEIAGHVQTARGYLDRTIERMSGQAGMNAALRAHFGAEGPAQRATILRNLQRIAEETDYSRHGWACRPRNTPSVNCPAGTAGATEPGSMIIMLCGDYGLEGFTEWTTVLHEVVHSAGVGQAAGRSEEVYMRPGSEYPPATDRALRNADSYMQFARQVGAPAWQPEAASADVDIPIRALAFGGIGLGRGNVSPVIGARLEWTPLGSALRVVDWTVGATFLWVPQYGVVPPGGGTPTDITDRAYVGAETGIRLQTTNRVGFFFDVSAGAGALWPGGQSPDFAISARATAGLRYGSSSSGFAAGIDLRGLFDTVRNDERGGWVIGLGVGGYFGGAERPNRP